MEWTHAFSIHDHFLFDHKTKSKYFVPSWKQWSCISLLNCHQDLLRELHSLIHFMAQGYDILLIITPLWMHSNSTSDQWDPGNLNNRNDVAYFLIFANGPWKVKYVEWFDNERKRCGGKKWKPLHTHNWKGIVLVATQSTANIFCWFLNIQFNNNRYEMF